MELSEDIDRATENLGSRVKAVIGPIWKEILCNVDKTGEAGSPVAFGSLQLSHPLCGASQVSLSLMKLEIDRCKPLYFSETNTRLNSEE